MFPHPPSSTLFPLHDALPIYHLRQCNRVFWALIGIATQHLGEQSPQGFWKHLELSTAQLCRRRGGRQQKVHCRSEEHTSELQSPYDLVCRLLLEKKKKKYKSI